MSKTALIVVDMQNDFMAGGALGVPNTQGLTTVINQLLRCDGFDLKIATQDWHPAGHSSFASSHEGNQVGDVIDLGDLKQNLWPDHCVQGTHGAKFVDNLDTRLLDIVFQKGTDPEIDSYSGFYDNGHLKSTGLSMFLKGKGVETVFICGVATDYCVKFTALDAVGEGFKTGLITDLCAGVNLKGADVAQALMEMDEAGVKMLDSSVFSWA